MDCPSEEKMIRLALARQDDIADISIDLIRRQLVIVHQQPSGDLLGILEALGLGASISETGPLTDTGVLPQGDPEQEASALRWLLLINGVMFLTEVTAGLLAQSTGLIADSLDMLADASVYGISLYVVNRSLDLQVKAAHVSGWLQLLLAFGVLFEVGRRFLFGSEPESILMVAFGFVALVANVICLVIIYGHRQGGAHMKASWIFSANDVIANIGVITAGVLVALTDSHYPDLIIGTIIGLIVLNGARKILSIQ